MCAEKRDTRAFAPICGIARTEPDLSLICTKDFTRSIARVLNSVYDGDARALRGVIECDETCDSVRSAFLELFALSALRGEIDPGEAEDFLKQLHKTMQPREPGFAWSQWAATYSILFPDSAVPFVKLAFAERLLDYEDGDLEGFEDSCVKARADREAVHATARAIHPPIDDATEYMGSWHIYTEEARLFAAAMDRFRKLLPKEISNAPPPQIARSVGRNDPCPCGSGRKHKKCCLDAWRNKTSAAA